MPLTLYEKRKVAAAVTIFAILAVTFYVDILRDLLYQHYIAGIVAVVAVFDIYLLFTYISNRYDSFPYVMMYIRGVPPDHRTYIDADGKFVYRYRGELNGAAKFRSGSRMITVRSDAASVTRNVDVTDNLTIFVDMGDPVITINTEYSGPIETAEEMRERRRADKGVRMFLFFIMNIFIFLGILRVFVKFGPF
jgi:hypothetical protein